MCIAFLLFDAHPKLPLLLLFNRDEFFNRPTKEAHWWDDEPHVLAGRDLLGGGTWLGITRTGRFALLTNFREKNFNSVAGAPSRGDLPTDFLKGNQSPRDYVNSVDPEGHNGFNLIVGDTSTRELAYLTNRGRGGKPALSLPAGLHGISNGVITDSWLKVDRGCRLLQQDVLDKKLLDEGVVPWDQLFTEVMGNTECAKDESELPATDMDRRLEMQLSSIFIKPIIPFTKGKLYGTRSQTGIAVWQDGRAELRERNISDQGEIQSEVTISFSVERGCRFAEGGISAAV